MEGIYKVGKFDPEILQKAERIAVPLLVTFCNRLPKAAVKPSKKEQPEDKKPPSSGAASRAPSSAKAGSNKELYERIERLEEAYRRLEKRVERLAAKSS